MHLLTSLVLLCSAFSAAHAVTVYGQIPLAQTAVATATDSSAATQTTLAAYDRTELTPPALPSPNPGANAYTLSLEKSAASVQGLSIPHVGGGFWGFSIEMSVVSQVLGKNSTFLQVPFLNLLANIQERAGSVLIRIGGNTQEFATLVPTDSIANGHTFSKEDSGSNQTTKTPAVLYTQDMFYMAANISQMLNVKWFMGIPFNDSVNWRLEIAENAQAIIGDNLLGLQAANEPDFYEKFGRRTTYSPELYSGELESLISTMDADSLITNKAQLLAPSVSGQWTPESVWDTGFIDKFKDRMYAFTVEHYPRDNCAAQFATGGDIVDPQQIFGDYLSHTGPVSLVSPYTNSTNLATAAGKPFLMFETNTASCGGFKGISDSYGAALWATDYGLQMAFNNFTHAMLHVGGQNAFYNPFTAPPTNQSTFNEWTAGAVYYATIILAEAFGTSNQSRLIDLWGNSGSVYTPSYAIYDGDALSKVALFNYLDDQTGASDINVTITVPQGVPSSISVKYLDATTVSTKNNITWAGQTLGGQFEVDGRFKGDLSVQKISCDTTANACVVPVPAPGFALVFMDTTEPAVSFGTATQTFATTAHTKSHNTATADPAVLATSNGHSAENRAGELGSTSPGSASSSGARRAAVASGLAGIVAACAGALWVGTALVR
ncbi:glycoside hydrolase family 79 protein [Hypholoma sublateritium FD-334 SS-4]|uniref:Glycoside hydrolase family 79 protein n=1 Tax=Hypholoma sublateritium (strain FD-334 SS-4) TaxID=945553 RepID=A0A0D2LCA0_HYPSF|nr:glycoside hydrolase family 79 protein [Hypholoma sublateritium FD-334 SS-4]